ncbi:MAG TPA: 50S ribosomal protein L29 [Vicinamibacterales bacterium]|nr:50S ribosomal protein L29 [Vicinamibacterales bacterium]
MKVVEQLSELRGLPVEDLRQRARDLDDQVFRLRIQRALGQAESGNKVRPLRKELARVRTVLREKGIKD